MLRALLFHPNRPKLRSLLLLVLTIGLLGYGAWSALGILQPRQTRLRLSAGQEHTRRYQLGQYLAEEGVEHGLSMELVTGTDALDTFAKWNAGEIDLALMSSGVTLPHRGDVRVVAGLNFEALHILVRKNLSTSGRSWLELLRRQRVNIGEPASNDYQLGSEFLRYLRLLEGDQVGKAKCIISCFSKEDLIEQAQAVSPLSLDPDRFHGSLGVAEERRVELNKLPDVMLFVASAPSPTAQAILDTGDYVLLPFDYAQAFIDADLRHDKPKPGQIDRACLEVVTIPASSYLGREPMPAADCKTIGMRSILVAKSHVPKAAIKRLMYGIFEGDFAQRIGPVSPRDLPTPYDIHPGAVAYLNRDNPIITESVFDIAGSSLSIFGAFSAGALTLWGYVRRKRIRRPEEYLEEIRKVDLLLAGQSSGQLHDAATVYQLEQRLLKLKEQLIHDYCGNRVQGEMVLLSILSMLADSRTQLQRSHAQQPRVEVPATVALPEAPPRPAPGRDVLRNLRPAA